MTKSKKLQKVTDFKDIKTVKAINKYLDTDPKETDDLMEDLYLRYNEACKDKEINEDEISAMIVKVWRYKKDEDSERIFRNNTYEVNHYHITSCIHNSILETRCFPSIGIIASETGLSRQTIYRHLNEGLKNKYNTIITGKLEYMASHALSKLYLIGVQDNNAAALKNFIELSGAIAKQPTTNVNNYIQINNLKISKDEFNQLPIDTIIQIEKLVSENLTKPNIAT